MVRSQRVRNIFAKLVPAAGERRRLRQVKKARLEQAKGSLNKYFNGHLAMVLTPRQLKKFAQIEANPDLGRPEKRSQLVEMLRNMKPARENKEFRQKWMLKASQRIEQEYY